MKERYKIAKMMQSQANDIYFIGLSAATVIVIAVMILWDGVNVLSGTAAAVISCAAIVIHLFFALQGGRITADDEKIVFRIFCFAYTFRYEDIKGTIIENTIQSDSNVAVPLRPAEIYETLTIITDKGRKVFCSRSKPDWDSITDDPTSVNDFLKTTCFQRVKEYIEERTNE